MTHIRPNDYSLKISDLIDNSVSKLNAAQTLAQNGDFNTASAILVTAFEERVKALVIQLVEIGLPIVNELSELNYVFSQHDSRHYIGFFIDCLHEIFEDITPIIKQFFSDKDFRSNLLRLEPTEEMEASFIFWISRKKDSFLKKIDFYQNIEKTRQGCLYVDVLRKTNPNAVISKEDYEFIKMRLDSVHILSNDFLEIWKDQDKTIMELMTESRQEMLAQNVPGLLKVGIDIIRKERGKAFNKLRKALTEFSVEDETKQE